MSDIKLFSIGQHSVTELESETVQLEKELQVLIESHMDVFLGVRFLAREYSTGKTHKGRIDSLGFDENGCPVIIEYKRHSNENVINQGLFYLDWLLDHQAEFKWLVMEKLGKEQAKEIEWSGTRLICIAADFNKYDEHAVQQINRNIELMRYRYFGKELLLLELVNAQTVQSSSSNSNLSVESEKGTYRKSYENSTQVKQIEFADDDLLQLFDTLCEFSLGLGDEVQRKDLKLYIAFKRIKNFACFIVQAQKDPKILVLLKLNPEDVELEEGFSRDVRDIGHWGTGDLELTVRNLNDLEKAKLLIEKSYLAS